MEAIKLEVVLCWQAAHTWTDEFLSSHDKRGVRHRAHFYPWQCKYKAIHLAGECCRPPTAEKLPGLVVFAGKKNTHKVMTQVDRWVGYALSFQLLLYLCLFQCLHSPDICNSRRPICQVVVEFTGELNGQPGGGCFEAFFGELQCLWWAVRCEI